METGLIYLGGEMVMNALGYGLVSVTISDTSHSILNILKGTMFDSTNYPGLTIFLEKNDVKNTIQIIESVINDIDKEVQKKNSVHLALESVLEIIYKIKDELNNIEKEISYHNDERYFAGYRTPYYQPYLKKIQELHEILKNRIDFLMNILKIHL